MGSEHHAMKSFRPTREKSKGPRIITLPPFLYAPPFRYFYVNTQTCKCIRQRLCMISIAHVGGVSTTSLAEDVSFFLEALQASLH